MESTINYKEIIVRDIEELSPELIQEVIDFIAFLKNKRLKKTVVNYHSLILQQENLSKIWNTESEDLYEL